MSEFYIKQPDTDHTRGPLSLEQLISLGETGNINEDTLLYDEVLEKWKPISSFPDILPAVFPQRKTLSLNRIEPAPTEDHVASEIAEGRVKPKVSTESILAAASGDTKETRHIGNRKKSRERAATMAVPGIGILLLISAVSLIYPAKDLVIEAISNENSFWVALLNPMVVIGFLFAAFAAGVLLGKTDLFPLVRYTAATCTGLMVYLFWAWQNPFLMICTLLMGGGLFFATVSTRYLPMLFSLCLGFIGAVSIAYLAATGIITYP